MSLWEALMMICFGASWPAAIIKTYTAKNPAGKSLLFAWLILAGYAAGITHKIVYSMDWVIWLYVLNFLMVGFDTWLVYYYRYVNRKKNETR